jgi:hypothetical protein
LQGFVKLESNTNLKIFCTPYKNGDEVHLTLLLII